ncbi:hypothetical protein [Pseudomonas tohonis]|uniref:hypothetical protein n=1 Tax=Pseudomonas tohonis TaxID=2725477 RepID=UPI0015648EF9|nr:hypothetical protein [Pseudomonas tohonis]
MLSLRSKLIDTILKLAEDYVVANDSFIAGKGNEANEGLASVKRRVLLDLCSAPKHLASFMMVMQRSSIGVEADE